jgi:ketosteroid isomerase-like protein
MKTSAGPVRATVGLLLAGLFLAVVAIPNCTGPPPQPIPDAAAVEAELRQFEEAHRQAIEAKDVDRVIEFYAPDLITVSPETGIVHGREWIRSACEELFRDYDFHEDFKLADMRILGDRVVATFTYEQRMTPLAGGEPVVVTGKGVGIFKRAEGGALQWEWNSYAPDAPAPAAESADSAKTPG